MLLAGSLAVVVELRGRPFGTRAGISRLPFYRASIEGLTIAIGENSSL